MSQLIKYIISKIQIKQDYYALMYSRMELIKMNDEYVAADFYIT